MSEVLNVKLREPKGKRSARRLRADGQVPAILYGHGESNQSLSIAADELQAMLRHNARIVDLKGDVTEKALVRALQWDTFGLEVLHVDLTRVSMDERVHLKVPVELRGEAAGHRAGGIVEQVAHEIEIECLAVAVPEKIDLKIGDLQIEQAILASQIPLPTGVTLISDPEMLIVHCIHPKKDDEEGAAAGSEEPEVIGRKAGEEEATEE
jgi:large subunit ribosomal protein L25